MKQVKNKSLKKLVLKKKTITIFNKKILSNLKGGDNAAGVSVANDCTTSTRPICR
jgi:hypothetical protein